MGRSDVLGLLFAGKAHCGAVDSSRQWRRSPYRVNGFGQQLG